MDITPFDAAPPVVIEAAAAPSAAIILVHGLGTSGEAFRPVAERISRKLTKPVRFILPNAPVQRVSFYGAQAVPAWFDLHDADFLAREDRPGLDAAAHYLSGLIDTEIERGMEPDQIILGGFSQGGAISLLAGLRYRRALGGIAALSGWLPLATSLARDRSAAGNPVPVFLGHGSIDRITPIGMAEAAHDRLSAWGNPVDLRTYPIGHTVDVAELDDLSDWLDARIT